MLVSIPCRCGAEIGLSDTRCRACNTPVSRELREALEASLEAAHPEYREARQSTRRSATVLLMAGLLFLGYALLAYVVINGSVFAPLSPEESWNRTAALIENVVIGSALIGCSLLTRRAPRAGFGVALGIWTAVQLLTVLAAPSNLLLAFLSAFGVAWLMGKIVLSVLLILGLLAARRLTRIVADVARIPPQPEREGASDAGVA